MADYQSKKSPFKLNKLRGVVRFHRHDRAEIIALWESGLSLREVVEKTGWPEPTVRGVLKPLEPSLEPKRERKPAVKEEPRPALREKPNPLALAREWLIDRPVWNGMTPRLGERSDCFLLDGVPATLDQVMRETYRTALRNGVELQFPNPAWMA